jgi:ribonuclease Z
MPYRLLTSLVVRLQGHLYIFDAGEGSQINLKKAKLGIKSLRLIAVSHLHGDHCLGVPGLLMMRAQVADPGPLTIIGPPGIERLVTELREILGFFINYPIRFAEWHEGSPEEAYEDELVRIRWETLDHTTLCLGYRLEEHPRPGKFRPEAAEAMGVPKGPSWRRLQKGETLNLENGVAVSPREVMGQPRPGRSLCYAVDTRNTPALDRLCRNVDLAFLDGMFLPEHRMEAEARGHMTVDAAARVARRVAARRAVLIHISPRYREEDIEKLQEAAAKEFPGSVVARDLEHYAVPLREDGD